MSELDRIKQVYAERRTCVPHDLYSYTRPDVFLGAQQVDRVTLDLFKRAGIDDFAHTRLLEVGCGSGGNLLRFLRWGFAPENLVGNELLEDSAIHARHFLPAKIAIITGDARELPEDQFDVVYQSTVLSSILDNEFQVAFASKMWSLTRPGGLLVSFDFVFNNPSHGNVRKVTNSRLRQLFPEGQLTSRRVNLAPPIARRVARLRPVYAALNAVPFLRTHSVCVIRKPERPDLHS